MSKKKVKEEKGRLSLEKKETQEIIQSKFSKKTLFIVVFIIIGIFIIFGGGSLAYAKLYENRVLHGTYLAEDYVGGFTEEQLLDWVKKTNERIGKGVEIEVVGEDGKEHRVVLGIASSTPLVKVSEKILVDALIKDKQSDNLLEKNFYKPLSNLVSPLQFPIPLSIEEAALKDSISNILLPFEDVPHNASLQISSVSPLNYTIIPEKEGSIFNHDRIFNQIKEKFEQLDFSPLKVMREKVNPEIAQSDIEFVISKLPEVFKAGSFEFSYIDQESLFTKKWSVKPENFMTWIEVKRNDKGELAFVPTQEKVASFLKENAAPYVDLEPQDALFRVEGDKVVEFKASRVGRGIDFDKVFTDLGVLFAMRMRGEEASSTIQIAGKQVEPRVKTGDVNNLGITDIMGVGISSFKGSPPNRIKNITHAVNKLNGVLIKPGEEFSANKYAGPYTLANGYLPELVIKGDKIEKDVGGGMCQIGTTLFRMAMNSGMDITERRNHSLVVNYYADPSNGNPGTDATLYEPILDLKFLNDTGNYLLLQTDVDYKKQQLIFTLWGKPDGRSGSYTPPIVKRWFGIGAPKEVVVDTLKPGQRQCQHAYRGAETTFTYTRLTPQGDKIDRIFNSYYRSLPQICMVGKEENSPTCEEGQDCSNPSVTSPVSEETISVPAEEIPIIQ